MPWSFILGGGEFYLRILSFLFYFEETEKKLVQTPKHSSKENIEPEIKNNPNAPNKSAESFLNISSNTIKTPAVNNTPKVKIPISQITPSETLKPKLPSPNVEKMKITSNTSEMPPTQKSPLKKISPKILTNKEAVKDNQISGNKISKTVLPIFNINSPIASSPLISTQNEIPVNVVKNISRSYEKNSNHCSNPIKLKIKTSELNASQKEAQLVNQSLATEKVSPAVLSQYTQTSIDFNVISQEMSTQTEEINLFNPPTLRHLASSSITPLLINPLILNQLKHYINLIQLIVNNNQRY